jgi:ribose-phosphate pyrophosphokinase
MLLFSLDADSPLAAPLAADLDENLAPLEERQFEDGELKLRPLVDPRGSDCYVVAGLHGGPALSPHDKLFRLLSFVATLKDHGADRVTAVVPYLAYARKDRITKPLDPLTLRTVAQLLEAVGTDQLMVLEAHNVSALQNAWRRPLVHLESHRLFDAVAREAAAQGPLAVASPDPGGVKRALLWREHLEERLGRVVGFAMIDKRRSAGVVSSSHLVAGDVVGAAVLLQDDLIASGGTMADAARSLRAAGASEVIACAGHGLFVGAAAATLSAAPIAQVVVSDSVPLFRWPAGALPPPRVVGAWPLFAAAIRESHAAWLR